MDGLDSEKLCEYSQTKGCTTTELRQAFQARLDTQLPWRNTARGLPSLLVNVVGGPVNPAGVIAINLVLSFTMTSQNKADSRSRLASAQAKRQTTAHCRKSKRSGLTQHDMLGVYIITELTAHCSKGSSTGLDVPAAAHQRSSNPAAPAPLTQTPEAHHNHHQAPPH